MHSFSLEFQFSANVPSKLKTCSFLRTLNSSDFCPTEQQKGSKSVSRTMNVAPTMGHCTLCVWHQIWSQNNIAAPILAHRILWVKNGAAMLFCTKFDSIQSRTNSRFLQSSMFSTLKAHLQKIETLGKKTAFLQPPNYPRPVI